MDQRLSVITLAVSDIARSAGFYEGLGWSVAARMEDVAFVQLNGVVLSLFTGLGEDAGIALGRGARIALAHNVRAAEEVDAALAEARAAGGRITQPARDTEWGGRSGYFTDPDGHLWEVAHNPFWPMTSDGAVTFKV